MNGYLLQHYLEESAARFPGKDAIRAGEQSITYRVLNEESGRLACSLLAAGFTVRAPAGIYLHKSIAAVTAMFAVLKAGGAYIPLDSHYAPPARVLDILKQSGLQYLVTDYNHVRSLLASLTADSTFPLAGVKVMLLDDLPAGAGAELSAALHAVKMEYYSCHNTPPGMPVANHNITDDDLAYILYTSGSTGIPKGVMLTHLNAKTFIHWALSCFKPEATDIFSSIAPLHFDLSVFDIYAAIAAGACVQLVPFHTMSNPRALLSWIRESRISFFYSVPSTWISILNYADLQTGSLPELTHLLYAGEVFPPAWLKILMEKIPQAAFYNLYGPTETNVCTYYHIRDKNDITAQSIPIGSACANTEVFVVKDDGTPAAVNEEGELLVKGSIVTKGYYKNPGLTALAFRKSPLPRHHGALCYATGDLVRITNDGGLVYLGRKDLMVKVAGFRVELPEVEHTLLKHESVQEAVAVPVFNGDGINVLSVTAFVTLKPRHQLRVVVLKEFLASLLPKYMIPETIISIPEIPRNGNNKADRQALLRLANKGVFNGN